MNVGLLRTTLLYCQGTESLTLKSSARQLDLFLPYDGKSVAFSRPQCVISGNEWAVPGLLFMFIVETLIQTGHKVLDTHGEVAESSVLGLGSRLERTKDGLQYTCSLTWRYVLHSLTTERIRLYHSL